MILDLDRLCKNLAHLTSQELDQLIDNRESGTFDEYWAQARALYPDSSIRFPNLKDIFIRISKATSGHEITSYIADDLDLIAAYEANNGGNQLFLDGLIRRYELGEIPS